MNMKRLFLILSLLISGLSYGQHLVGTDVKLLNGSSSTAGTTNGTFYYDVGLGQFRFRQAGSWSGLGGLPSSAQGYLLNNGTGTLSWDGQPTYLGSILNQTSFPNTTGFTNHGSTNSIVSNAIQFTGGANTVSQTLDYTYDSDLEYVNIVAVFTVQGTLSSTSYGFGIGKRGSGANAPTGNRLKFDMTNTGTAGQMTLYDNSGTLLATSSSNLSFSLNDQIEITYIIEKDVYTFYARNLTAATNPTTSLAYNYANNNGLSQPARPNMGRYCIASFGGTFSLNSLKIYSKDLMRSELLIVADSKGLYYSSQWNKRWTELLRNDIASMVVNAGGSEVTSDVLAKINEIISLKPKKVLLLIGSNDVRTSVSSATYIANYDNIVTQLLAVGIDVYHTLFNEAGINQNTLWNHITGTYPASNIIDNYTYQLPLLDGIHLNDDGNRMAYTNIINSGLNYNVTRNLLNSPIRLSDLGNLAFDEKNSRFSVGQTLTGVANGVSAFNTAVTFSSTITNPFVLTGGANALQLMQYNNSNAGTSTGIGFQFITTAGNAYLYSTPANYTDANAQSAVVVRSVAGGQVSLYNSSGLDFVVKGQKVGIGVIPSTNSLEIVASTGIKISTGATNPFVHSGSNNALTLSTYTNTSAGTASGIGFQLSSSTSTGYIYQTITGYTNASLANSTVIDGRGTNTIITNGSTIALQTVSSSGNVLHAAKTFLGGTATTPTALAHFAAETASASTAPIKFTAPAALMSTPEAVTLGPSINGDYLNFTTTTGTVRRVIVAGSSGRATGQTALNNSVATYTLGATDASYEVSANVLVTTSSAENFTVTTTYTDEGNTSRTVTMNFQILAGTIATAINFSNGAVPYEGIPLHIRCKASTSITVKTTGTFTGCTYNVEGIIKQTN